MIKGTPLAPLTGTLDLRSPPDEMPVGGLRWRQNFRSVEENKIRRGHGFNKFLSGSSYNNDDLHDQLLYLSGDTRKPLTLLFEAESSYGARKLYVANASTVFEHNPNTGNYRIIGSGFGRDETTANGIRFEVAQQGDYLVFTNDYDAPMYYRLDSEEMVEFPDLATIGLTKAAGVFTWKNVVFFFDVEMDSRRMPFRLVWGDYDNPTSFDPFKAESIAGFKDLDSNERILRFEVAGDVGILYTTRGMWQISVIGGEQSFAFNRLYDGAQNEYVGLLKYPKTLVSLGTTHLYLSDDKIFSFSPYQMLPSAEEWIHRGSKKLFSEMDPTACKSHVGGLDHDEIYFSVARVGDSNQCPSLTLRLNTRYKVADYIDHGFLAFSSSQPDYGKNVRDFMLDNRICTIEELNEDDMGFEKEGLPRSLPGPTAPFEPQTICTATPLVIDDEVTSEDYNVPNCDADSLCALLGDRRIDDECRRCDSARIFIAVSSQDWCIKQMNTVFFREICTNPTAVGTIEENGYMASVGTYSQAGYDSILRFAPAYSKDGDVTAHSFEVKYLAKAETPAQYIRLRVGLSAMPSDPNTDECRIVWHTHSNKELRCLTAKTAEQHLATNTQPYDRAGWNFVRSAHYIHFELKISGVGGDAEFSGVVVDLTEKQRRNNV